jgi:POT family proton-dependent oligopeptide transporter
MKAKTHYSKKSFFGHPQGLSTLFFTEMWERFSYYGMRAILILFMVTPSENGGLGLSVAAAGAVYALYTASVYLACLPGGWIADQLTGQKNATFAGAIIIMFGHLALAVPLETTFYLGLFLLVVGTGLLKPNISIMVGQLYAQNDHRRDAGYSIYYMGINIGAFLSPLVCGWLAQDQAFKGALENWGIDAGASWHFGFGAAALGMALGILNYLRGQAFLGDIAWDRPSDTVQAKSRRKVARCLFYLTGVLLTIWGLLKVGSISLTPELVGNLFGVFLLAITLGFFWWLYTSEQWTVKQRKDLKMMLILFIGATIFWSLYEQGGSTLNLFAERNTSTTFLGYNFPASWMQSLNPIYIFLVLAPAFAFLWMRLGSREPSSIVKFTIGLGFMCAGWTVMIAAAVNASEGALVSPLWLAVMYFLLAAGEMCLSPVGLSAISRLAPTKIAGLTMGVWFLASSIGSYIGGRVAGFYETFSLIQLFATLALIALVATLVFGLLAKPLNRALKS